MSFRSNLFIIKTMNLLSAEQKIALIFQKDNNIIEMICTIEKVLDDRLELALPQYFMRYIDKLQVGARLTVKVFTKLGTIDFNTVIITSPLEDEFYIELDYNAIKLTSGEKIPVVNAIEDIDIETDKDIISTSTIELSTEHVKFTSSKRKYAINDVIRGTLALPEDYGIIYFEAVISEIDTVFDDEYKATFTTITEEDKQNLLYYMYMYSKDTEQDDL